MLASDGKNWYGRGEVGSGNRIHGTGSRWSGKGGNERRRKKEEKRGGVEVEESNIRTGGGQEEGKYVYIYICTHISRKMRVIVYLYI